MCERLPKDKCLLTSDVHAQVSCDYCKIAEFLVNEGYRKTSDIAREIFDEIARYIRLNEDIAIKCKEENGEQNREYFKGKLAAYLQIRGFIDVELKRKYK